MSKSRREFLYQTGHIVVSCLGIGPYFVKEWESH